MQLLMLPGNPATDRPQPQPRLGQVVLEATTELEPSPQFRSLYRLSDPALSELGLDEFLDELLVRVRDALAVDTVAILLLDPVSQQLVARAAKGIEEEVERGVRIPIGQGFAGRIAAERVAIFVADVDHADILNPILREKGISSLLGVPLIVEGDLIGVLHVGSLEPRTFAERDLAVLQVAAARAAPGIERARLFSAHEHEHRIAIALQRSLLPKRLIQVPGVTAAARYLPASDEVGGDWYDIFELGRGRVGVAIGDVVGHGVGAAALMGQLRTALHAYAMEGYGPGRTLELVDRFVQALPGFAMATAAYAVIDPDSLEFRLASAGHLPPLLFGAERTRIVEFAAAPPLGAFPYGTCPEHVLNLASGETVVLYTDGLVERAGTPLMTSIAQLLAEIRCAASLEDACQLVFERMVPGEALADDAAMIAISVDEVPSRLSLHLAADPGVLASARRSVRRWLKRHNVGDREAGDITLAVGEACTNAIEHAYSPAPAEFTLAASLDDGVVTIAVRDRGEWRPARGIGRGRGLAIVRAVMDEVEVNRDPSGTEIVMRKGVGHDAS
jgi:anti-sigma regulatory factor (Ser/Thr protein kinase)/putative methionine-R-sulfoxide reductase with GAF domain